MAEGEDSISPPIRVRDMPEGQVQLQFLIRGVEPGPGPNEHKNGDLDITLLDGGKCLDTRITVVDKKTKKETVYRKVIQRLPCRVKNKKMTVKKDVVVVDLTKTESNLSWNSVLNRKGTLDMTEVSSSSEDSS